MMMYEAPQISEPRSPDLAAGACLPLPLLSLEERGMRVTAAVLHGQRIAHPFVQLHEEARHAGVCSGTAVHIEHMGQYSW